MTPFMKAGMQVAGAVGAMVLVFGIGAGSTSAKTVQVEKVVEKQVTPSACLDYIDLSEEGFGYVGDAIGYARQILAGQADLDASAIRSANRGLDDVNAGLDTLTPKILAAKAECRDQS